MGTEGILVSATATVETQTDKKLAHERETWISDGLLMGSSGIVVTPSPVSQNEMDKTMENEQ